jgi:predicted transposase/invertase (TIGR01784 family)
LKKGIQLGRQKGLEQGRQEGRQETTSKIVVEMFNKGIDLAMIEQITGLPKDQIRAVKKHQKS